MAKLFVIAGHGAGDPGAGGYGYSEAERVRALAKRMKELGGGNVELGDLTKNYYASNLVSSLKVSCPVIELHMDAASASARGGHVIIKDGYSPDRYDNALASFIGSMFPGRSNTIVGRSNLANVNRAAARGINYRLLEVCFITNRNDLDKFNSSLDVIAKGILKAFDINTNSEGWQKDSRGWWYRYANGTYPSNEWKKIDNEWYWFDDTGYAATEWRQIDGKWYWFNRTDEGTECAMVSNCVRYIWGLPYAFGRDGAMLTGSIQIAENGHLILG